MRVVLVTGGFDPLHSGHIAYFKAAKELGDILCVGVNSDEWLTRKKGRPFMPFEERKAIIENIKCVGNAFGFNDDDGSAIEAIRHVKEMFPRTSEIVFANGGDRTKDNIPEMVFDDVEFVFGVGGEDKKNSSSWILKNWSKPSVQRAWGTYTVLDKNGHWQVKELSFDVGKSLSDQRHHARSEHWHLVQGRIRMDLEFSNGDRMSKTYHSGDSIDIPVNTWHKATNVGEVQAKVIEVWMGDHLSEDDIERRD
jgi:cytidyltransferase-like protein